MLHKPLLSIITITTLGVAVLGVNMMRGNGQKEEEQKAQFTTQQVTPTFTVSGGTTITTIDPNTCMITEIQACKKRFWKDFDENTCKEVMFKVDCMFYDETKKDQNEYNKLLGEYSLVGRDETDIACDAHLIENILVHGNACEEKDLGKTISDTNTKGMCRDNSRTCRKVIREGKEVLLREKNLATRYDPTGKTEICDGNDNDCDGQVDEGYQQKEYLRDFDGDGWGNLDMKTKACLPLPGHVLKPGDCDDLDKAVYPGAYEVCDLKDNNCNRQIDEYLVDCHEEVKECSVMLPVGGMGGEWNNNNNNNGGEGDVESVDGEIITRTNSKVIEEIKKILLMKYKNHEHDIIILFKDIIDISDLFHSFNDYKNEPYAGEILKIIAAKVNGGNFLIKQYERYKDQSYVGDVLKTIATSDRSSMLKFDYNLLIENPNLKDHINDIFTIIGQKAGGYIIKEFDIVLYTEELSQEVKNALITGILDKNNRPDLLLYKDKLAKDSRFDKINKFFDDILSIKILAIGNKTMTLQYPDHVNIFAGLVKTYSNSKEEGNMLTKKSELIKVYESNLKKFIASGKVFSSKSKLHTFIVRADHEGGDDHNSALTNYSNELITLYQCLGSQGTCTSIKSNEQKLTPDEIINLFAKQIYDNPDGYHLFHLGGHGGEDGSLGLVGGNRTKAHFNKLFNLQSKYPGHIRIDITSCNSFRKDDNRKNNAIRNIAMDSSQQSALAGEQGFLLEAFEKKDKSGNLEADYDEDGVVNYHEALIYRAIHYNGSLTPIMFDDNGKVVDIVGADILPQDIQDRSDRENDPFVDTTCDIDC